MLELCGKVVTIRQVYYDTEHYIIEEENVFHNWQDYMF
jgi:hypothetical protein